MRRQGQNMNLSSIFEHPEPAKDALKVVPVFTPFAGCPGRCVFCAQNLTTGGGPKPLKDVYASCRDLLEDLAAASGPPRELAFYGGTFTALPDNWPRRFMTLAGEYKKRGVLSRIRCSTRPDAVTSKILIDLKELGLDLVELGVQSFDPEVLDASGRGHGPREVYAAAETVQRAGMALGVQLLPGLPGMDAAIFRRDVEQAIGLAPECARLYPLQVLEGTPLARMWRAGEYEPWGLDETVERLAFALDRFWLAGIRVIRVGLAPESALESGVLAGPRHPAMGQLAKSRALYMTVERRVRELGRPPKSLAVPRRWYSDVAGHKGEMLPVYARIGITPENIIQVDGPDFGLS
jgi:histone acetyltransferase (RNA polymerase elongator complex component)